MFQVREPSWGGGWGGGLLLCNSETLPLSTSLAKIVDLFFITFVSVQLL